VLPLHRPGYEWQPGFIALQVLCDGLIALVYFSAAITLLFIVRKRADLKFDWMFLIASIFMAACGATHLMEILTIWRPLDWLSGVIKAITALAAVAISIVLLKWVPGALRLPSPSALQSANLEMKREVGERIRAEQDLRRMTETLEARVADRTEQFEALNRTLLHDSTRVAIAADAAGLGFWNFDIRANALQWDERMYRLYGLSPSEGEQPYALWASSLHPMDRERFAQESADALIHKNAYDTEFRIVHPNGAVRHLRASVRIMRDADGHPLQMFGVNFDITERKRADEQFRLAIEAAPTGMLLMNLTGSIVLVNAQIENLFGYPRTELLGRQIEMLVPERQRGRHPHSPEEFFGVPRARAMGAGLELFGLRKDGVEVPIEIALNPLHTSDGEFVLSSIIDLTQRQEMDRLRTDFVSTVSHELRTPLTSISGSLGLLQSGALGALPDKAAAMVRIAYKNSGRLVRIINDMLDIGRLEAGKLALQMVSVPLAELLQQSVEVNAGYAEKCGVRFLLDTGSCDHRVLADPDRLMQVITNLLSNAAKFSPPGADVLIRLRTDAETMRVEVEDSGDGIPEAFQSRIFEKFAQADGSATRRFEGTGLGLSIARKLTQAMGGAIGFSSVVGRGSVFHLELPRIDASPAVLQLQLTETAAHQMLRSWGATAAGKNSAVPRLLYVEYDEDLIGVMRATLAGRAEILSAHNLRDAERLLREEQLELVILEQSLPDGNAINLVDRVPALAGHSLPIVILSATEVPPEVRRKVSAVLLKSQVSAAQVATTILSFLPASRA
jgi:PAS domain S-box-containing protein